MKRRIVVTMFAVDEPSGDNLLYKYLNSCKLIVEDDDKEVLEVTESTIFNAIREAVLDEIKHFEEDGLCVQIWEDE